MYIEDRLFSENTEEVLYSVTMTEDEYALFSEFQKEFASVRDAKKLIKLKGGLLKKAKRKGIDPAELTSSFKGRSLVEGALVKAGSKKPYSEKTWNNMVKGIESGKINSKVVLKESEKIKKLTDGHMQQIHGSL